MFKKLLYGMAIIAGLASCTDDYTDWANPQSNSANEAAEKTTLVVTPAATTVDFANVTEETIQLFATNLEAGQTDGYTVTLSGVDVENTVVLEAAADGTVAAEELKAAVEAIYGKAPEPRTLNVAVSAAVTIPTADGSIVSTKEADPYQMTVTLVAPYISEHYYIIGAPSSWALDDTSLPFTHSGGNVYDNPEFTCVFPVQEGENWFAITDDQTLEQNDWSYVLGCAEGNGNNGETGFIKRRTDLSDDGSWKIVVDGDAKFVKMTINMMDYSYKLEKLNFAEYIYIPGNHQGWDPATAQRLYSPEQNGWYSGFCYMDGEFKFTQGPNWTGGEYNSSDFTTATGATLGEGTGNMSVSPAGFYYLVADVANGTLTATATTTWGIIGSAAPGGWDADTDMTYNSAEECWEATITLADGTIKFRANDAWDINVGGTMDNLVADGADISVTAGTYLVKLYLTRSASENIYCTMTAQ